MTQCSCPLKLRVRSTPGVNHVFRHIVWVNENAPFYDADLNTDDGEVSSISDWVTDYKKLPKGRKCSKARKRFCFKDVTNSKTVRNVDFGRFSASWDLTATNTTHWSTDKLVVFRGPRPSPLAVFRSATGDGNLELISNLELQAAIARITPSVDTLLTNTTNLWETIFELNDIKKLLGLGVVSADKSLVTNLAEKHLGYSFGWVPLSKEFHTVQQIFHELDNVIDEWNKKAYAKKVIDFKEFITPKDDYSYYDLSVPCTAPCVWSNTTVATWQVKGIAERVGRLHIYVVPKPIPDNMRYRVLMKALGLDKPITGAWEAVPFSWIVDYFVNIGDFINNLESGLDSMFKYDLISAGYSVKSSVDCSVTFRETAIPYNGGRQTTPFDGILGTEVGSTYIRRRLPVKGFFNGPRVDDTLRFRMNLGWKQGSYLTALAILMKR